MGLVLLPVLVSMCLLVSASMLILEFVAGEVMVTGLADTVAYMLSALAQYPVAVPDDEALL